MAAWNPERSLVPPTGATQPFAWDQASTETQRSLEERVRTLRAQPLPEPTLRSLRLWFRTQHVYHSNAIEGSTLTLYETQVVIGDGLTVGGKPLRDVLAAKNLASALDWVEELGRGNEPLNERTVREIHGLVMRGEDEVLPGRYKTENNLVAGARFRTPSFLQTPPLMEALGRYLSGSLQADPIGASAVAHAWLVGIHPFRDGNGRTARLLANLVLIRNGFPVALLTEDRRPEYYAALDQAHCTGDLGDFVALWRECVGTTLEEYERLGGALQTRERDVEYLANLVTASDSARQQRSEQWRAAVDNLTGELRALAQGFNARVDESNRVEVSATRVTDAHLAEAKSHTVPVIQLLARPSRTLLEIGLARSTSPLAPAGLALTLLWNDRPGEKDRLARMLLDGARFTLVWESAKGFNSEEAERSFPEAANLLFREAIEKSAHRG